jgi:hypothetical protein
MQGGERRLNVAITRARTKVMLFSSFDPKDIELARTNARGTRDLRAYLELAAGGPQRSRGTSAHTGALPDQVAADIAEAIRARGHEVELDYGLSHFTVDLVVRTPEARTWQVAILLDGPSWARRETVADRDAAPVLLGSIMGWQEVVRIWLPQWIAGRDKVLDRIDEAIAAAQAVQDAQPIVVDEPVRVPVVSAPAPTFQHVVAPTLPTFDNTDGVELFRPFVPTAVGSREQIDTLPRSPAVQQLVRQCMTDVIKAEGPVEIARLIRFVYQSFGLQRVRSSRRDLMSRYLPDGFRITTGNQTRFVWPRNIDPESWRGFRQTASSADRAFEEVSPEEIINAMSHALETREVRGGEQLLRITRELLGYGRTTQSMEAVLRQALRRGIDSGRLPGNIEQRWEDPIRN